MVYAYLAQNRPQTGSDDGDFVFTANITEGEMMQLCFSPNNKIFFRAKNRGTWGTWREL